MARVQQLGRHLALIRQYWGDGADADGRFSCRSGPIRYRWFWVAADRRMMELVRNYADWWNLQANHIDRLPKLAPAAGTRPGVGPADDRLRPVGQRSGHRPRGEHPAIRQPGAGTGLRQCRRTDRHFAGLAAQRVERFYVWFADFAVPDSLHEFGESVIKEFPRDAGGALP